MTVFSLNYLLKALSSNIVKLGVRTPNIRTWGETVQPIGVCMCVYIKHMSSRGLHDIFNLKKEMYA